MNEYNIHSRKAKEHISRNVGIKTIKIKIKCIVTSKDH